MSPLGIASSLYSLLSSISSGSSSSTKGRDAQSSATSTASGDFSSSLALSMASLQSKSVNSLGSLNSLFGQSVSGGNASSNFDFLSALGGQSTGASDLLSSLGLTGKSSGLSALGRNLNLFNPESAYRMMSEVNNRDVNYKAQFSELSEMKSAVADMQQAGKALGDITASGDSVAIKSQLQAFANKYNDWVSRFESTVQSGGVLAGTQAAEVSLHELRQSVQNIFNGAKDGFHGLKDLGFTIDPTTHRATLDTTKLDSALANNHTGVINTVSEFSQNFTKSAELLNSSNNFIPNRLANLDRVIDYIRDNKSSLQAEFGLGDVAKPSALVAKALEAYNKAARA